MIFYPWYPSIMQTVGVGQIIQMREAAACLRSRAEVIARLAADNDNRKDLGI